MGAEQLFELVRHLTERDREVALYLYRHRVLTTGQLQLLFFSSRRRAQARLLFLYRQRVLDRFYPPSPFGLGKPEAHWLLDEAGALLVAATLERERKRLGWQRRDDWASHPQLAHRLESNRFVTDLIAATLTDSGLGMSEWWPTAEAADRLNSGYERVLPDGGFYLETRAGPIECYLEWDRGTETQTRLAEKLLAYRLTEARLYDDGKEPCCLVLVVPGARRLQTLRRAYREYEQKWEQRQSRSHFRYPDGRWPLIASTAVELRAQGPLASVWERLDQQPARRLALTDLPARRDLKPADLGSVLGRRWRKDHPEFWTRLSPLGARTPDEATPVAGTPADLADPEAEVFLEHVRQLRERELEQALQDAADFRVGGLTSAPEGDLRSSAIDGSMDDSGDDVEEERWR